jgi:crotonobetainyl-CoA:carnitine CoA-transferase CaiB-like acyl-CoA transferase
MGFLLACLPETAPAPPQRIESSLLGGAMWLSQMNLQHALFSGKELRPLDHASDPLLNSYQCQNGRWIFIAAPSERAWPALCAGLGLEALTSDPRFHDFEARWANRVALITPLEERFASRAAADWALDFAQQPELVFEVVHRPTDISTDPQVLANGYVAETDHPELGRTQRVAVPLHLNGALSRRRGCGAGAWPAYRRDTDVGSRFEPGGTRCSTRAGDDLAKCRKKCRKRRTAWQPRATKPYCKK